MPSASARSPTAAAPVRTTRVGTETNTLANPASRNAVGMTARTRSSRESRRRTSVRSAVSSMSLANARSHRRLKLRPDSTRNSVDHIFRTHTAVFPWFSSTSLEYIDSIFGRALAVMRRAETGSAAFICEESYMRAMDLTGNDAPGGGTGRRRRRPLSVTATVLGKK